MPWFRVEHPTSRETYAIGGHDHALGFFCETFREGREKPLKSLDVFTHGKPVGIQDCFDFLISKGFFTVDQLQDILVCLQDGTKVPKRLLRIEKVVTEFKNCGK